MKCAEVSEFLSALCDGETIPREAALHIAECVACQQQLSAYTAIGVELRRMASLEAVEAPPVRSWDRQQNRLALWWQKGVATMRIPRVAFGMLVLCLVLVGTRLAVVEVGAHSASNAVKIAVDFGLGSAPQPCYLQQGNRKAHDCSVGTVAQNGKSSSSYSIFLKQFDGARFQLEVRGLVQRADERGIISPIPIMSQPAHELWLTPGQAVELPLANGDKMKLVGEWIDHTSAFMTLAANPTIDPNANELRFASPILVRDGRVVGDLEGFACRSSGQQTAARLYYPKAGRFSFALEPFPGALEATVRDSRVIFSVDGQQYMLINGTPVARGEKIWVLREAKIPPQERVSPIACGNARSIGLPLQQ